MDNTNRITPELITQLQKDEIFVFGSNLEGQHWGGAARAAHKNFGAVWDEGVGLHGQTYAIPTMHGGVDAIRPYVDDFIAFAREHKELHFLVTRIGCGIAGFTPDEMAPLFDEALELENVWLPGAFISVLEANRKKQAAPADKPNMDEAYRVVPQLIEWAQDHACPTRHHGLSHWNRVAANGQQLCDLASEQEPGSPYYEAGTINRRVVLLFAYLHDSCRQDDYADLEHGPRAARQIKDLRDNMLAFLSDEEFRLLQRAIRMHTAAQLSDNLTVNLCLDADRLDLGRVGIIPDPDRMASRVGAMLASTEA